MPAVITPCGGGGGGGGGIQFDTDPQSGDFLLVDTVDSLPSGIGAGYGIVLRPSDGLMIYTGSAFSVYAASAGISSTAALTIAAGTTLALTASGSTGLTVAASNGFLNIQGTNWDAGHYTGPIRFTLATGSVFTVYKANGTTKVFEVRDNGTVHIPTGQTVLADL